MVSLVQPFNKFNIPRVAQLSQRSNQFNLRTVRYTEADLESLSVSKNYFTFTFTLEDKFGENGLISVIILKKENKQTLFIDTWFMSCRVLKRGMEYFSLNQIINTAREHNFKTIVGEYIPTAKNEIVKDHYKNLGFEEKGNFWVLNVDNYESKNTYIKIKS
jgi:FkbH-like protein